MFQNISPSIVISEILGTDEHTSYEIFLVLSTIFIASLILLIFLCVRKSKKKSVYILGVADAGKTTLFSKLVTKGQTSPLTVTSQTANVCDEYCAAVAKKVLRLIDIPGADKVRSSILSSFLVQHTASAIVFVVDSTTVVKDSRSAAEWLYSALADHFDGRPPPLLIVCTKQDVPGAKSSRAIRSALEREFGALHRTRGAAPDATSGGAKRTLLGVANSQSDASFDFDRLPAGCVFVECAALAQPCDLKQVEKWLSEI